MYLHRLGLNFLSQQNLHANGEYVVVRKDEWSKLVEIFDKNEHLNALLEPLSIEVVSENEVRHKSKVYETIDVIRREGKNMTEGYF